MERNNDWKFYNGKLTKYEVTWKTSESDSEVKAMGYEHSMHLGSEYALPNVEVLTRRRPAEGKEPVEKYLVWFDMANDVQAIFVPDFLELFHLMRDIAPMVTAAMMDQARRASEDHALNHRAIPANDCLHCSMTPER